MSKRAVALVNLPSLVAALRLPEQTMVVGAELDGDNLALTLDHPGLQEVADDAPLPLIKPEFRRYHSGEVLWADWGYQPGQVYRRQGKPSPPRRSRKVKDGEEG